MSHVALQSLRQPKRLPQSRGPTTSQPSRITALAPAVDNKLATHAESLENRRRIRVEQAAMRQLQDFDDEISDKD